MAYIGRDTDKLSNIEVLDTITFDGSSSYTLQKNSVNFTPSSANNVLVSIDGVVQANNFTTSGSTIDFGVAVPSTSTCDWIYHIGVGLITTPADGTVSLAKLSATGTKDSTTFLRGDNTFAVPTDNGKILQVVQSAKTDTFSSASASWVDITDLSLNITPSSTSSKIFVTANFVTSHSAANSLGVRLMRDSTSIFAGDDTTTRVGTTSWQYVAGSNQNQGSNSFQYVDSPSTTSATTYKLQMWVTGGTGYLGQMEVDNNNTTYGRSASSIIAMEIGA